MPNDVLVDSSLWISHLRDDDVLERHIAIEDAVTCPPVVQEVLQGTSTVDDYRARQTMFSLIRIVESPMSLEVFFEAAEIYRNIRSKGFTIRNSVDCLIAACALRNHLLLLHADRDFDVIARFTLLQAKNVT